MREGIIIKGVGGFYDVLMKGETIRCKARGKFRNEKITPMVGDRVRINLDDQAIEEILQRKNQLIRPAVANIDFLGIVIAVVQPEPDFTLVDNLIINAEINDIKPILLINKVDLGHPDDIHHIQDVYRLTHYPIILLSCKERIGIDELSVFLKQGIITFSGQSGVGKSSIINMLCPEKELNTGDLSDRIKRGRHTTRHVELLSLHSGGMVVDTPGFSTMAMDMLTPDNLSHYYPEFRPYFNQCRFSGCIHYHEPQCRVKEAVQEGKISEERYERYIKIIQELKENRRGMW